MKSGIAMVTHKACEVRKQTQQVE